MRANFEREGDRERWRGWVGTSSVQPQDQSLGTPSSATPRMLPPNPPGSSSPSPSWSRKVKVHKRRKQREFGRLLEIYRPRARAGRPATITGTARGRRDHPHQTPASKLSRSPNSFSSQPRLSGDPLDESATKERGTIRTCRRAAANRDSIPTSEEILFSESPSL